MDKKQYETKEEYKERWDNVVKELYAMPRSPDHRIIKCPECDKSIDPIVTTNTISYLMKHVREEHPWAPPPDSCGNCRFIKPVTDGNNFYCRRYPPVLMFNSEGDEFGTSYPEITPEMWCGEWKEKDNG